MSLFDTIRYPITTQYRLEDLKRLPTPLLENWWAWAQTHRHKHVNRSRIPCSPERISAYMNNSTRKDIRVELLKKLKEDISAWDSIEETL